MAGRSLADLPDEILVHILSFIDHTSLCECMSTCHALRTAASRSELWEPTLPRRAVDTLQYLAERLSLETHPPWVRHRVVSTDVWTGGYNGGPSRWGVPTAPPVSFGQLGRAAGELCATTGDALLRPPAVEQPEEEDRKLWPLLRIPRHIFTTTITQVSCGGFHTAFLTSHGRVWTCGSGSFGQTGHGDRQSRWEPTPTAAFRDIDGQTVTSPVVVASVVCGFAFTLLLDTSGTVFSCGFNRNGRCGLTDQQCEKTEDGDGICTVPRAIAATADHRVLALAAGSGHSLALLANDEAHAGDRTDTAPAPPLVVGWGRNDCGQLGIDEPRDDAVESIRMRYTHHAEQYKIKRVALPPGVRVTLIHAHGYGSCCADDTGRLWLWGCFVNTPVSMQAPPAIDGDACSHHQGATVVDASVQYPIVGCVYSCGCPATFLYPVLPGQGPRPFPFVGFAQWKAARRHAAGPDWPAIKESLRPTSVVRYGFCTLFTTAGGQLLVQLHPVANADDQDIPLDGIFWGTLVRVAVDLFVALEDVAVFGVSVGSSHVVLQAHSVARALQEQTCEVCGKAGPTAVDPHNGHPCFSCQASADHTEAAGGAATS
eukprot:m.204055 g.204055  ORF g.204055 m.204055 type:complete len:598 (-) comp18459_c0_seq5:106-1899(-)